jgi:hypothetical protein
MTILGRTGVSCAKCAYLPFPVKPYDMAKPRNPIDPEITGKQVQAVAWHRSIRDITEWTDCDFVEYNYMVILGLIDPINSEYNGKAKHVFWSSNDVGTAIHEMLETLVKLGMLEKRDEPDLQYRWNQEFKGSWE